MLKRSLHGGKVKAFLVAYGSQECTNPAPEFRNGALGGLSQERFEIAEDLLDWVEIRGIRWHGGRESLFEEDRPVHPLIDHEGREPSCHDAGRQQQGCWTPMAVRSGPGQSFAPR